ncbi:aldo/keto reductase [Dactylosporangium sp. CA-152071]|uniref:aldo/keto reductase n=1 Tax=Dactylosporangium sp. CA-152071 TaxID=3239933 RepID=UPI003D8A3103
MTVEQLVEASRIMPIASVQNRYNLTDRASEPVLEHCERHGIAFLPWLPVAPLSRGSDISGDAVSRVAARLGATRTQVALAWLLHRSPVVLPIPGTSRLAHLEENVAAAGITLGPADLDELE